MTGLTQQLGVLSHCLNGLRDEWVDAYKVVVSVA